MSRVSRFFSTIVAVIIGNILLFAIIIATLYFLFKNQIENFKIDKIKTTISEIQEAIAKLDSSQIKKFQEGVDKFTNFDLDSFKTQLDSVKNIQTKLDDIIKQIKEISEALKKIPSTTSPTTSAVSHSLLNWSVLEFADNLRLTEIL
ncbi:hypothetical protein DR095_02535 [Mycoplasma flocculare]|uniref:Transmembrane protein n=2 Tax=Mesomycoplasma flocculare TaxID=2128 RepID=A0A0A8E6V4_MESFC|nr:hypothetical protein [Mesomycoplasma flocculare]MXR39427.1 hypothetical protein [Mycoplasma sp. MF12]AJC49955.1 hypothetical protein MYF_02280 [Mesomycoplasma flocculare ATCC 27399]MXR05836.1 hypothetical protein [Mesomycoplasma flocculare]MXR12248.1 hypothetical protein [Mesomycoplasma flocculare]MXR13462.1 hypothetical protein [Mesomycoplasma flocculare]